MPKKCTWEFVGGAEFVNKCLQQDPPWDVYYDKECSCPVCKEWQKEKCDMKVCLTCGGPAEENGSVAETV